MQTIFFLSDYANGIIEDGPVERGKKKRTPPPKRKTNRNRDKKQTGCGTVDEEKGNGVHRCHFATWTDAMALDRWPVDRGDLRAAAQCTDGVREMLLGLRTNRNYTNGWPTRCDLPATLVYIRVASLNTNYSSSALFLFSVVSLPSGFWKEKKNLLPWENSRKNYKKKIFKWPIGVGRKEKSCPRLPILGCFSFGWLTREIPDIYRDVARTSSV